jgi:hypothetical protein
MRSENVRRGLLAGLIVLVFGVGVNLGINQPPFAPIIGGLVCGAAVAAGALILQRAERSR